MDKKPDSIPLLDAVISGTIRDSGAVIVGAAGAVRAYARTTHRVIMSVR